MLYNYIMKVKDMLKIIKDDGWVVVATKGSHRQFKHSNKKGRVTIAGHPSDELARGTANSILKQAGLKEKTLRLIELISKNPYENPPSFEKLLGFNNVYSRRINIKHRLVYEVISEEKAIKIISIWGHYDDN